MKNKLIIAIACLFLFAGCTQNVKAPEKEWYTKVDTLTLPNDIVQSTAQCVVEDRIYVGGMTNDGVAVGYTSNQGEFGTVELPEDYEFIYAFCQNKNGITMLVGTFPHVYYDVEGNLVINNDVEGKLSILEYDEFGECRNQIAIPETYCDSGMIWKQLFSTEDGYILICQDAIVKLDKAGGEISRLVPEEAKFFGACEAAGDLFVCQYDVKGEDSEIFIIDEVHLETRDRIYLPKCVAIGIGVANDGRLMIYDQQSTGSKISFLDEETGLTTTEFMLNDLGLSDISCFTIIPFDGGFFVSGSYQKELYIVRYVYGEAGERKQLILAVDNDFQISDMVDYFNLHNEDYKIVVKTYGVYGSPSWDTLRMEIASGKGPDIFAFSYGDPFQTKDDYILEDLLPYLDEDPEFGQELFVPSFLNALENEDELKWIPLGMKIYTFISPANIVSQSGVSPETLNIKFHEQNDYERIFPFWLDKTNILGWMSFVINDIYVDKEMGTCHYDSEEFVNLLQFINQWGNTSNGSANGDVVDVVDKREGFLALGTVTPMYITTIKSNYKDNYNYMGFPTYSGNGSIFACDIHLGICSQSNNKEGAWEFVRLAMDNRFSSSKGSSALVSDIEAVFQSMTVRKSENVSNDTMITQTDIDKYWELVNNTSALYNTDQVLEDILVEEANMYFAGDCSAEQAAATIQSRASIYLAERN